MKSFLEIVTFMAVIDQESYFLNKVLDNIDLALIIRSNIFYAMVEE